MLCNGNVADANSPINFKNDSFCPTSLRDFSTLSNDGTSERGFFDPLKSKVNCAVPNGLYV
jgi:hypothetical protein